MVTRSFLLLFILLACYLAILVPAAQATTIDITPQQVPGETIPVETEIKSGGAVEGKIGPKENEVKFPILNLQKRLFSDPILQNRALPAKLIPQLKLETPLPASLSGQLGHVTCGKAQIIKKTKKIVTDPTTGEPVLDPITGKPIETIEEEQQEDNNVYIESTPASFSATQDYGSLFSPTRFWQSIFLPKKGTDLNIGFTQATPSPLPTRLSDCGPEPQGTTLDQVQVTNQGPQNFNPIQGIVDAIRGFFDNILHGPSYATLNSQSKQVKLLPGEAVLKDQTVGDNGFLNFFKPAKAQFSKQGDQESPVAYTAGTKDIEKDVTYAGVASLKGGSEDLIKSLYPAKLASQINFGDIVQLPPSSREYKGLTYTIPYRNTNVTISPQVKESVIAQVLNWKSTSRIKELWDTVEQAALSSGINPAFMLAIWIEESAGSFGGAQSDFGCFPDGDTSQTVPFEKSMSCFINFTTKERPNDFKDWVRYFCGPNQEPICRNNSNFIRELRSWYDRIVPPGSPGGSTPL